jgi:hypothetical protein
MAWTLELLLALKPVGGASEMGADCTESVDTPHTIDFVIDNPDVELGLPLCGDGAGRIV